LKSFGTGLAWPLISQSTRDKVLVGEAVGNATNVVGVWAAREVLKSTLEFTQGKDLCCALLMAADLGLVRRKP